MKPRGLQPVAINGKSRERRSRKDTRNPLPPAATGCLRNGKEGVDGSSPSEGSYEKPANVVPHLQVFRKNPLTDSNRRPPPYHFVGNRWQPVATDSACLCGFGALSICR